MAKWIFFNQMVAERLGLSVEFHQPSFIAHFFRWPAPFPVQSTSQPEARRLLQVAGGQQFGDGVEEYALEALFAAEFQGCVHELAPQPNAPAGRIRDEPPQLGLGGWVGG